MIALKLISNSLQLISTASDIQKCRGGDGECLPGVITSVISRVANGHPGLNLPPIDPLHINAINMQSGSNSPVNINLDLMNQDLHGLTNIKVKKVRGFEKNPEGQLFDVDAFVDRVKLIGQYKIDGRVLVLPIQGQGRSNLTLDNLNINIKFTTRSTVKNNNLYIQTTKMRFTFDVSRLYIYLENLFNGDKALSDNMNLFLNENWKDIFQELRPSIQDAFSQIVDSLINSVFAKIPYSDIYLD